MYLIAGLGNPDKNISIPDTILASWPLMPWRTSFPVRSVKSGSRGLCGQAFYKGREAASAQAYDLYEPVRRIHSRGGLLLQAGAFTDHSAL